MKTNETHPKISEIMNRHLYVLNKRERLSKATRIFDKYNIRHLPVIENKQLIGILSNTDIARLEFADIYRNGLTESTETFFDELRVEQVMIKNPHTISEDDYIEEVALLLMKEEFHALPVVDKQNELQGIVTTSDIIEFLLERYERCCGQILEELKEGKKVKTK